MRWMRRKADLWPRDMVISVDHDVSAFRELLWVREAWGLRPVGDDLPPLLENTPPRAGQPDARHAWESAWPEVWQDVVGHAAELVAPSLFDELQGTANGSQERVELLRRICGPTWRDRFGHAAFGDGYRVWSARRSAECPDLRLGSLDEPPERRSLEALIPAWEAGLAKVITIPCRGEYTRILGDSVLLMTQATRSAPDRYAVALRIFARG